MEKTRARYQNIGFFLGPVLAALVLVLPPAEGISLEAWRVIAMALWMATWWSTEAIPVPATSLIPLIFLPLFGITSPDQAARPYGDDVIFLLLGGFIIAMAMQRWNLHKRIALNILARVGGHPAALIGGFMAAAALLSMWISNTATTLMMIPIALSVANAVSGGKKGHTFTIALVLGVAYASSIGGFGTIIGTPPNAIAVGYLADNHGIDISFAQWMMFGIPVVFLMVPAAWLVLTKWAFPLKGIRAEKGKQAIINELKDLGLITTPEKRTAFLFALIAFSWMFRPLLNDLPGLGGLNDMTIAIAGAVLMFVIPSGSKQQKGAFLLNWEWAVKLPWGVILLFGGGLSLANAIKITGLSLWMGEALSGLTAFPLLFLMLALIVMVVFLTELTSNTATTAGLMPVLGALAVVGDYNPLLLAVPAALAASCAFMLPVATAPNAIVFASGQVTIPQMCKAGFRLNLVAIIIVTTLSYALVPLIFT
ncbi:MAG: DASS family sodium-coupled anion symporter [Proteobacteria bacterium]|nr:DASS family sodium-coupled anion symporter [Pseudomonadota bacterium]